jgi:OPT oligopeptide transporter protein
MFVCLLIRRSPIAHGFLFSVQFSMWSYDVTNSAIYLSGDLKMGQYLKMPPRVMVLTQVWGTILGPSIIL